MLVKDLETMIMYTGETTYKECMGSVRRQTYQPARTIVIENVFPLNSSINERHRRMELPYSIKVDADMILYQGAFEALYKEIKQLGTEYWGISGMLLDPFLDEMGGVHIQRTEYLKDIEVPNRIGADRWLAKLMKSKGYKHKEFPVVLGEHRSDWSLEAIFKRHVRVGQKDIYFQSAKKGLIENKLIQKVQAGNRRARLALFGYQYGLTVPDKKEKGANYMEKEWIRVEQFINEGAIMGGRV